MYRLLCALLMTTLAGQAAAEIGCQGTRVPQPLPVRSGVLPALAQELPGADPTEGSVSGLLAPAADEARAMDVVLLRLRLDDCGAVASTSAPAAPHAAGYVPKTKDDNTPWRFDMHQNGKRMSADEFDAWMKARGVRVARGKPAAAAPAAQTGVVGN